MKTSGSWSVIRHLDNRGKLIRCIHRVPEEAYDAKLEGFKTKYLSMFIEYFILRNDETMVKHIVAA